MKLNLSLLSRILSQPWAIRKDTLCTWTPALFNGQFEARVAAVESRERTFAAGVIPLSEEGECAAERSSFPAMPEGLTTILVWGVLGRGWTELDRWYLDAIEVDELTAAIAATPEGSTVVLWFRSPGGIVTGIPETAGELRRLGKTRRLLAFTDDLCASAAYWLAAQCEQIVATPTADVGSIGVYLAFYDFVNARDERRQAGAVQSR